MNKIKTCSEKSKWYKKCKSRNKKIKCYGCGFKYFARILECHPNHKNLNFLGEKFSKLCSEDRKSPGGRPRLDKPIWELFYKEINGIEKLTTEEKFCTVNVENKRIRLSIKCDGAFKCNDKFFFYEIKGAGDNTNDVLSAITAAQLLKESDEFEKSSYYYIGVCSGKKNLACGLTKEAFHDVNRSKIFPYVKWAENKRIIEFWGIVDIDDLITTIKKKAKE